MRSRMRRSNSRLGEIASFWAMIVICSLLLSGGAFVAAKYWVGGLMARSKSPKAAPQLVLKTPEEMKSEAGADDTEKVDPPAQASIKMQQRAPTDGEKSEIEQKYPQDAAQMHESGKPDSADDSTGGDDKPIAAPEASTGEYAVVASSFKREENARKEVEALSHRGYNPRIVEITRDGETYHRVVVASFESREEAEKLRDKLRGEGTEATITTR